ncbi:hypothetical protein P1X14_18130 [Sphingomonas sp. AOB5]|uniref:hypothetical protein n=1 Tax=Sphingomonas sp. AOB5 TaxID=3034017 RepID=UPI0023F7A7A7|nr:hypothetical protein [Sphingomonas sp. AOB5]MDF7777183.1 hypothetical protein [Sphingomonas sp. AOB5]
MIALWLAALAFGALSPQDTPIELKGKCVPNPTLPSMMKQRDGAKDVTTVQCDRVVIEPGKQASFYKGDTLVATFAGHPGDASDITMDSVTVGKAVAAPTSNGRCRIYRNDSSGEVLMLCFAVYRDGETTLGAVATFSSGRN